MSDHVIWNVPDRFGNICESWPIPRAWVEPVMSTAGRPGYGWRVSVPANADIHPAVRGQSFVVLAEDIVFPDEPTFVSAPPS